jgi:hypothetical protein
MSLHINIFLIYSSVGLLVVINFSQIPCIHRGVLFSLYMSNVCVDASHCSRTHLPKTYKCLDHYISMEGQKMQNGALVLLSLLVLGCFSIRVTRK